MLIVDEASTIGDRDLLTLLRLADRAGATARLIGDTAQHGSIPAGGSFAQLITLGETPELTEIRRLRDPGQRRRAELVRSGNIGRALDELVASGQLELTDSDADTYAAIIGRWYEHRQADNPHPMVHGRNRQRRLLNQIAQAVLAADGTIDMTQAVITRDGRRLAVGDDVTARHGDRSIHPPGDRAAWMRNGTTGRIVAAHHGPDPAEDRITVQTAGGLIGCGRSVFDRRRGGIDHGYAVTSYSVQGSTRSASTSAITATTARSELYVDITRGRDTNQLYGTRLTNDGDTEAHLPRLDSELIPTLHRHLARGTVRTALAVDPDALAVSGARRGRNLLGLLAARQRGENGPIDQAIHRTTAAVRRQARSTPPDTLRKVTGRTKSAVTKHLRDLRIEAAKGIDVAQRPLTVEQVARQWLAVAAPKRRQPSTMARLTRRIEQHVIPGVGQRRVDQLRPEDVEAWLTSEAAVGQSLRTIQDYRGDLRQILGWAERRRLVTWNAAKEAELPLDAKRSDPKRSLTLAQLARLYVALEGDRMAPYFVMLAELGLRPQEADALRWSEVDLDAGVVSIVWAMKRGDGGTPLDVGIPKTPGSRRKLRLTSAAADALARRKAEQAAERLAAGAVWSCDDRWANLVFTSEIGTPMHPSNVRRTLRAAIQRANSDPELDQEATPELVVSGGFTPYEFGRHTAASLAVDAGATPYEVADLLGHTTTRMLDRHYRHRVSEIVDTAADIERRRTSTPPT